MALDEKDIAALRDMLHYANIIVLEIAGLKFETYDEVESLRMVVERGMEIIGEAARKVSDEVRRGHPEIPWRDIIGQRNVLAHQYGSIDSELVWSTAKNDVPELVKEREKLLANEKEQDET